MNVGLQKTCLVNYPQRVAAAVFLPGCNLRCPYCYNAELVYAPVDKGPPHTQYTGRNTYIPIEEVYTHIEKRKHVLSGLAISGGEALLSPVLPELIMRAKSAGLAVKLDTNGLMPEALEALLNNADLCPDMIALDIKTAPTRYRELHFHPPENNAVQQCSAEGEITAALLRTITLLRRHTLWRHAVKVEYRTVLVPPLVAAADIYAIAEHLPANAEWFFSPFLPISCLNPHWNTIKPYTREETDALLSIARQFIPNTRLR